MTKYRIVLEFDAERDADADNFAAELDSMMELSGDLDMVEEINTTDPYPVEEKADALTRAAPDLRDALSPCIGFAESYAELIAADDPPHPETAAAWRAVEAGRAAIAKAEGR